MWRTGSSETLPTSAGISEDLRLSPQKLVTFLEDAGVRRLAQDQFQTVLHLKPSPGAFFDAPS